MILKAIREGLGRIIVFFDYITRPKKMQRSDDEQNQVNQKAKSLALYQFYACPFCVRVRRLINTLNIPIEYRDTQHDAEYREELLREGGKSQVPCLRIEKNGQKTWLYESKAINAYLEENFGIK